MYDCEVTYLRNAPDEADSRIILALQGTNGAHDLLQQLTDFDLDSLGYFKAAYMELSIGGRKVRRLVQRTGYTGEDGFEIHLHPDETVSFWDQVIALGAKPAGLEARDILRLEAGLPLYGHEWFFKGGPMPFEFRFPFVLNIKNEGAFAGDYIGKQKAIERFNSSTMRLVGIKVLDRATLPYNGNKVLDNAGKEIGVVTSGCFSPSLKTPIGLVYIEKEHAELGSIIKIGLNGAEVYAKVVNAPFINHIVSDRSKYEQDRARFYIPGTPADRQRKLDLTSEKLGIDSIDGLYTDLIRYFHNNSMGLPAPVSARQLHRELYALSVKDLSNLISFYGSGYYHEPPSDLVRYLLGKHGITTAYTPYQSEVSQGNLRLMFLYQSLMAKFLGMDAVNASLYDGANALAAGISMAVNATDRKKIIIAGAINPQHKAVVDTYARNIGIEVTYIAQDGETGRINLKELSTAITEDVASVVVQQPNFLGMLETEIDKIAQITKERKVLLHIHSNDPLAFAQVRTPGSYSADIATAEGQSLVGAPYYGGNNLGIIACAQAWINYMPGRFIGQTQDADGKTAFALALTHREQHVARKDATSNICTNVALNALCAANYMLNMGESGLNAITLKSHQLAMNFAAKVSEIPGLRVYGKGAIFREVIVESDIPADDLIKALRARGIAVSRVKSYDSDLNDKNLINFAFTANHTPKDVNDLIEALKLVLADPKFKNLKLHQEDGLDEISDDDKRVAELDIPDLPEPALRSFIDAQAALNYNPKDNPYPLGSCTMMWNPEINEIVAMLEGFLALHPSQEDVPQGLLQILYELERYLANITGMDATSLNPSAGAHGEYAGLNAILSYHESRSDHKRKIVITTDSSHGTNPSSIAMQAAEVIQVKTNTQTGRLDMNDLSAVIKRHKGKIAAIMLTEPNTIGLFEDLERAARLVHEDGGLVYMDGANLNSIVGRIRPGDLDVDVIHINLHKTFSTPHGTGGPGAGPICVKERLRDFLAYPRINLNDGVYSVEDNPSGDHIGSFLGNIGVLIRAYAYIRVLGQEGLRAASGDAVLNANYLMARLMDDFDIPFAKGKPRMHEFVITISNILAKYGVSANDVSKRLQDYGIHPPTTNFPHIAGVLEEVLMFEPTQSMSLEFLDRIADAMLSILEEIKADAQIVTTAPHDMPVKRVDDDKVQRSDVPLKNTNILAILGIGENELVAEPPPAVVPLFDYEDPFDAWEADVGESHPNEDDEEWFRVIEHDGRIFAVVGLTQHTVDEINIKSKNRDAIKKVILPSIGDEVYADEVCATMQTSKAGFEIFSPISGRVVSVNRYSANYTESVNKDPYGKGWLFVVELKERPTIIEYSHEKTEASVGITENDVNAAGGISTHEFPFANLGMAHVVGKARGSVKIFIDDQSREILGAHITGRSSHADQLIKVIELAIKLDATVEDLADLVFAHPTLPEAIGEAAELALNRSVHTMPAVKPDSAKTDLYDLMIVGAGPAGYVAAIRAAQLGMKVVIMDKDHHGGTCLNRGCIPTKAIIENLKKLADGEEPDLEMLRRKTDRVVGGLRDGIGVLLEANGIDVIQGEFNMQDATRTADRWDISAGDSTYKAKNLMLATGSVPATLPGLTIDHEKIIDSNDALGLEGVPETLTIIGAGAIGLEFARIYKALGSEVTVVEMQDQICPGVLDRDMAEKLQEQMAVQGIAFKLGTAFDATSIPEGTVLVAVGRTPNTAELGMPPAVLTNRGEIIVNEQYQAEGVPGLLAVGDNIAMRKEDTTQRLPQLAHAASKEGKNAVEALADVDGIEPLYYNDIPAVVFTNPEVAIVGITEEKAESIHLDAEASYFIYPDNESLVKVVVGKGAGIILGVQIIGPAAPYAIAEMALAVKKKAELSQLIGTHLSPLRPDKPFTWHSPVTLLDIDSSA